MALQRKALAQSNRLYIGRDTAAEMLDVSTRFVDLAIRSKELPAFRLGKRVLIRTSDLVAYAERVSA